MSSETRERLEEAGLPFVTMKQVRVLKLLLCPAWCVTGSLTANIEMIYDLKGHNALCDYLAKSPCRQAAEVYLGSAAEYEKMCDNQIISF